MATYTKALKSITITTIGGGTITATDTAADPVASNALYEFEQFKTMHIKGTENTTLVPFHAVDHIVVTTSSASVEKSDAYGCEEENDSENNG